MITDCKHSIILQSIHTEQVHLKYAKRCFEKTVLKDVDPK